MITDLLWNIFEKSGMVNIYLLYKQINNPDKELYSNRTKNQTINVK